MSKLTVDEADSGSRLDHYLATHNDSISRNQWQQQIESGLVTVNSQRVKSSATLQANDVVKIIERSESTAITADIPIIYQDDNVIVIDKPHGLLVHAVSETDTEQTVVGLLRGKLPTDDSLRPGVVHRLDRDTSGVMVLAKTQSTADDLTTQFKTRTVEKTYRAVLEGQFQHEQAKIAVPIGRDMNNPSHFKVDPNGKTAETLLTILDVENDKTYVKLQPKTGRTHQLRVHCQHIGHPIVGDPLYGQSGPRLMLHAHTLVIDVDGQRQTFRAPLPVGFRS